MPQNASSRSKNNITFRFKWSFLKWTEVVINRPYFCKRWCGRWDCCSYYIVNLIATVELTTDHLMCCYILANHFHCLKHYMSSVWNSKILESQIMVAMMFKPQSSVFSPAIQHFFFPALFFRRHTVWLNTPQWPRATQTVRSSEIVLSKLETFFNWLTCWRYSSGLDIPWILPFVF